MKLANLLDQIFVDAAAVLFDQNSDAEIAVTDYDTAESGIADMELPCIDLVTEQGTHAIAVMQESDGGPIQFNTEKATFFLEDGERYVAVFVLDEPTKDVVSDSVLTEIPASWKFSKGTGEFFATVEDVHAALVDTDEEGNSTLSMEDADESGDTRAEQVPSDDGAAPAQEPTLINDAELIGTEHEDMAALLSKKTAFMTGDLYDQGDRRNTQAGNWKLNDTFSWGELITAEWSPLTSHPVSKIKQGSSIVLGETIDGNRNAESVKTMGAIVLDIDSGPTFESVRDMLISKGVFACIYTSFNNKKTEVVLKHDEVVRKLKLDDTPTRPQVIEYLRLHHKDRYDDDFLEGITIEDPRRHGPKGLQIILSTPPLHKFRVVLPLWEPVELVDLGTTASQWKDAWADIVTGFVVNELGISFDSTSCDVNRLFYTARHPKDGDWDSVVIQGRPIRISEIEPYSKNAYLKNRTPSNPFSMAGSGGADDARPPQCLAPSGMVLNAWHTKAKERFLITDLLNTEAADKVRREVSDGKVEIECVFEHEHSTEGGTGTVAMAPHSNDHGVWSISCPHDACQGRHKLEHLEEMLKAGWFDEECLTDDEYLIPGDGDDDSEEEQETPEEKKDILLELANKLPDDCDDASVLKCMRRAISFGTDQAGQNKISKVIMEKSALTRANLNKMWRGAQQTLNREEKEGASEDLSNFTGIPVANQWDSDDLVTYARRRIADENEKNPFLFHYMEELARIEQDEDGIPKVRMLSEQQFEAELNTMTKWNNITFSGDTQVERGVPAPGFVVKQIYHSRRNVYPPLRGMVTSPIFTKKGELLTTPGYHASSGLYYEPDLSVDIPKVSHVPTKKEVDEALELLVDTIADFPLGGLMRGEIMKQAFGKNGIPAVTHCLSMILLLFAREMVIGATPGHLMTKPAPGTGASLLNDVCSIIATGLPTPAVAMPRNPEEMSKTLITFMADGSPIIYFDNINGSVDSGELASAMTAPKYKARMLGKSQTVEAEVRCVWVFTGNNVQLSNELLRRLVMIDLDARMANPEMRTKFKRGDIITWTKENRGDLVHACLTIIQNWIAQGRPSYEGPVLNSFENWTRVMGGIMQCAGMNGFLGNRDELKEIASDDSDDEVVPLLDTWWDEHGEEKVVVKLNKDLPSLMSLALENDIQLPIRMKVTVDGDRTLDGRAFGKFLTQHRGRVFILTSGEEVMIEKLPNRHKHGTLWRLVEAGGTEE